MALVLVVEDGTGKPTANSYASRPEGDAYHDAHLYASAWTGASTGNREIALAMATRMLDATVEWSGYKVSDAQALQWPRSSAWDRAGYTIASNVVPPAVKFATIELARLMLTDDRTSEPDTLGFRRIKVGSIELEVERGDRRGFLTPLIWGLLGPLAAGGMNSGTVKLVRT